MGVTRALLLMALVAFAVAGTAYSAVLLTNDYVIKAAISPLRSGTTARPRPVARYLEWDVSTAPPGRRPANDLSYVIATVGLQQRTANFPKCGTSVLSAAGPGACPRGSLIGTGFAIMELGPTGENMSSYNATCRVEEKLFDGGKNKESLYIFAGSPRPGQPGPCQIPGGHAAVNVRLSSQAGRLNEAFSLPTSLLHPAPGIDATIVREVINIPARSKTLRHPGFRRRVALFGSYFCPPNHLRQVTVTFTREDGVGGTATVLMPCTA